MKPPPTHPDDRLLPVGLRPPAGVKLLSWTSYEGKGNAVYLLGEDEEPKVLKVYRRRRGSRWRRLLQTLSHYAFEGKRGNHPADRRETERLTLSLWAENGFDVFRLLEGERPGWVPAEEPILWLEYVPGRALHDLLFDDDVPAERKRELVVRLAKDHALRHRRAVETGQVLLLQEHPTVKHAWISDEGDRLLTMDLEIGYQESYPIHDAVGQELAGVIRSLWHHEGSDCFAAGGWPRVYLDAYGDTDLLREGAAALRSGSIYWRAKRIGDRRQRRGRAKTEVAAQLLTALEGRS